MIEGVLYSLLSAICPDTYPTVAPAGVVAPFIIYTRVSTPRLRDLGGAAGMAMPLFQIDVYAPSYDGARTIASAVRQTIDGYRDAHVCDMACVNEQDMSDQTSSPSITRVMMEFRITHYE